MLSDSTDLRTNGHDGSRRACPRLVLFEMATGVHPFMRPDGTVNPPMGPPVPVRGAEEGRGGGSGTRRVS